MDDFSSTILRIRSWSSWSSWRLQGLIPVEFLYFWIFFDVAYGMDALVRPKISWSLGVWKCLRKASIYRSLRVGEWHVAKFNWWHVSQSDWRRFKTFFSKTCGIFWLAEMFWFSRWHMSAPDWIACNIAYTHRCVIGFCMLFVSLFQWHLANFCWFLNSDNKT